MRKFLALLLVHASFALHAQLFHTMYGSEDPAHPSFAAAPDAFYLAHGSDNEVIKTALDGVLIWSKRMELNGAPVPVHRIAYLNGQLIVAGGLAPEQSFLAGLDTDGNVLWAGGADFNSVNHIITRILPMGTGYATVGHREFPNGAELNFDVIVCGWDSTGQLLWDRAIGNNSFDLWAWAAVGMPNGDIVIAGEFKSPAYSTPFVMRLNQYGDILWKNLFENDDDFYQYIRTTDLVATSDGEFAILATTDNQFSNPDAHVIKFDGDGNVLWGKRMYQTPWWEQSGSIIEEGGQLLMSGVHYSGGTTRGHVARMSLDGTPVDQITLPYFRPTSDSGLYYGIGQDLVTLGGGSYALAGECASSTSTPGMHGLTTFSFDQEPACGAISPYAYSTEDAIWYTGSNLIAEPFYDITDVPASLTSTPVTIPVTNACTALGLDVRQAPAPLVVYPNPVVGQLRYQGTLPPGTVVRIYDALGSAVRTERVSGTALVHVADLAPGLYYLGAQRDGTELRCRFIKQ